MNFLMFKLVLEKAEEPEILFPTSAGSWKKQEFLKNIYFCFIDYAKAFDCVDHNKLWEILKQMGILDHVTCLLRSLFGRHLPGTSPQLIQGIRRRDGLGDYLYANQRCQE